MNDFKTPPIPEWIPKISHRAYKNIFDFALGNRNLWGTETLLGDWEGEHLIIAKDFYPTSYISDGMIAGVPNPYCHKPGIPTNRNLTKILSNFGFLGNGVVNTNCDFLYCSACFLLRDDGIIRGRLPDEEKVLALSAPVLDFTIEHMPRLKKIVAMGSEADRALQSGDFPKIIKIRNVRYFKVSHPAAAMADVARFDQWNPIFGRSK